MLRVNQCIRLGSELYKTTQETALLRSSKCMITVKRGTLVVNILKKGKLMGYVFYGKAKLCLDAIIETSEGALGKAITKEFNGPFIMLMGERRMTTSPKQVVKMLKISSKSPLILGKSFCVTWRAVGLKMRKT